MQHSKILARLTSASHLTSVSRFASQVAVPAALAVTSFAALGCTTGSDPVQSPTWLEDVRPIVQANCLRCHTPPSIGGAPSDFRLDSYEDTALPDGRVLRGAKTMARFIAFRAGEDGTMPPDGARSDGQRDTLINWWQAGAPLGNVSGNSLPTAELLSELSPVDDTEISLLYQVDDADGDLVSGSLRVGDLFVSGLVTNGRGSADIDPAQLPAGNYPIVLSLTDDLSQADITLGTLAVSHANGNTAPSIAFESRLGDGLLADANFPLDLVIAVDDPDAGDTLSVDVDAVRGDEVVNIATNAAVVTGSNVIPWPSAATLSETAGWRIRVTASDGTSSSVTESGGFRVSHQSTALTYADMEPLLYEACAACHHDGEIPGETAPNFIAGPDAKGQLDALRGTIYRRVILEETMPPVSAPAIAREEGLPWRALSEAEREQLAEYLLGGSPD